jgi:hypothetical protein
MRPLQKAGAFDGVGFSLVFNHGPIWQVTHACFMPCEALRMKLAVKVIDLAFSQKLLCFSSTAEKTGPVARCQCCDFIKEEERRVAFAHGLMLHVLVVHIAANPVVAGPAALAKRLVITVKLATAIAHNGAAFRHRNDATVWLNAVLQGHGREPEL